MPVINSIEDLRALARRRVPRALFDYVDRGAYDEQTLRRNRADLDALQFRQRIMVDLSALSLESTLLGAKVSDAARHRTHRPGRLRARRR